MGVEKQYDIVIVGAGMAGLSLVRQLLLNQCDRKILLLDNRAELPGSKQKVGESLVQVAGYYFTRILDLEEHLLREHFPKFNLRFHWKTPGRSNTSFEDYGWAYLGKSSNVSTYQLNRNSLEKHMLELALAAPNVTLAAPVTALQVDLSNDGGPHRLRFGLNGDQVETKTEWLIDSSGRTQFIKKRNDMQVESPINHGSTWCWVEGLVNIEKLTDRSPREIRSRRDMQKQGLFPVWLATNHFCGEGFWFWVIPLQGMTSLGVVYDSNIFPVERVTTPEKLIEWVCEEFPLFARDLPKRKIVDSGRFASYAYDSHRTISAAKWAMTGMSGRFSDPLYSPGSDLIAYYNTMIVDAIMDPDPESLKMKAELYENLMKVVYDAYVPSYYISYDVLGDQEIFTLKYAWELAVYFCFYTFPFINDLFTNPAFIRTFFRKFAQLGPINRNLQKFMSDYFQWKKQRGLQPRMPVGNNILDLTPLKRAEMCYYTTGLTTERAEEVLDMHLHDMKEFARYIYAHIASVILDDRSAVNNRAFVSGIKLRQFMFDPESLKRSYAAASDCMEKYEWNLDPGAMDIFRSNYAESLSPVT